MSSTMAGREMEHMMERLTHDDYTALAAQDDQSLAVGWCALNRHEWPAWLPDPETETRTVPVNETRCLAAMNWISNRVGLRACLREWNRERMNDAEFDDFWRGHHDGDEAAMTRYKRRIAAEHP